MTREPPVLSDQPVARAAERTDAVSVRANQRWQHWRQATREALPILGLFLASRMAIEIMALLAVRLLPAFPDEGQLYRLQPPQGLSPVRMWDQFDAGFYRDIGVHGYWPPGTGEGKQNWVFFPAYPWLVARLAEPFGVVEAFHAVGVAVSMALAFVGLLATSRLARQMGVSGLAVVALIVTYPSSFYFNAPYTEGMYLAASGLALMFGAQRRFIPAGAAAAVATVTRPPGVLLLLPLGIVWLSSRLTRSSPWFRDRAWLELIGLGLPLLSFGWLLLMYQQATGDPLAFAHNQSASWRGESVNPLQTLLTAIRDIPRAPIHPALWSIHPIDLAASLLAVAASVYLLARRQYALGVYGLLLAVLPLSTGVVVSMTRYMAVNIPMFIVLAMLTDRVEWLRTATIIVFAVLLGFETALFVVGVHSVV